MEKQTEIPAFKIIKLLSEDAIFCQSWKPFCWALKFYSPIMEELEKMESSHRPTMEIITNIMMHWKKTGSPAANIHTLCDMLIEVGCTRSAEYIKTLAQDGNIETWSDITSLQDNFMTMESFRNLIQENSIPVDEMNLIQAKIQSIRQSRCLTYEVSSSSVTRRHNNEMEPALPEIWCLPPRNANFVGRVDLLKKVEEYFNQGNQPLILTAYDGLGGVGKTHTALEYCWRHYKEYKGVLWFNAENKQLLMENYIQLGRTLRLRIDSEKMSFEEKARYVKHWLENPIRAGWLIVYDNAPVYGGEDGINEYIPVKGGRVLITSRYSVGWPQHFSVKVFTREESKTFIEKVLPGKLSEEEKVALAEKLGDLPLALAQACAYMDKNRRINISRYLELYMTKRENLLKDKTLAEGQGIIPADSHKAKVYITWDITMEAICRESLLAANWLNCCAYLAPNDIPHILIETFAGSRDENPNSEIYEEALGVLRSYSMLTINKENHSASIHRLVQEVIQLKEERKEEEKWKALSSAWQVLFICFPSSDNTNPGRDKMRKLMPHLEICLPFLQRRLNYISQVSPELVRETERDQMIPFLDCIAEGYNRSGDRVKEISIREQALTINVKYYGSDHVEVAGTLSNLGNAYRALGKAEKGRDMLEQALAIQEKYYGADDVEVAATLANLGSVYLSLGDAGKGRDLLEKALVMEEKHFGSEHIAVAMTLTNLGTVYGSLGDTGKKRDMLERALAINEKYYGSDHVEVARTLTNLGVAYGVLGDGEKALCVLKRALAINEKNYGLGHLVVGVTLTNIGVAYGILGDAENKRIVLERALTINEEHYGPDHVEVAVTLTNLGSAYKLLGDSEKARDILERALAIKENYYVSDHVEIAFTLTNLGEALVSLGEAEKARDILERALGINEKYYGLDHVEVSVTSTNLAVAYGLLGNTQKTLELLERALAIEEKYYGLHHIQVAVTLMNLAFMYESLENGEKARDMLERVLVIKEEYHGPDHVDLAVILDNLASLNVLLGDTEKARDMLERSLVINEKCYGPTHITTLNTLRLLIRSYKTTQNISEKTTQCKKLALIMKDATLLLHTSAGEGDLDFVQFFVACGGDVMKRYEHATILHQAVSGDSPDVVQLIIKEIKVKLGQSEELYQEAIDAKDSDGEVPGQKTYALRPNA